MAVRRRLWACAGLLLVTLGFIGYVVPGMPSTIFMILALYCFKRGSDRFEQWLLNHRLFGQTLRDWERTGGIRPRTKKVAIASLWLCMSLSLYLLRQKPVVMAVVAACGIGVTWYILSRPNVLDPEPVAAGVQPVATTDTL